MVIVRELTKEEFTKYKSIKPESRPAYLRNIGAERPLKRGEKITVKTMTTEPQFPEGFGIKDEEGRQVPITPGELSKHGEERTVTAEELEKMKGRGKETKSYSQILGESKELLTPEQREKRESLKDETTKRAYTYTQLGGYSMAKRLESSPKAREQFFKERGRIQAQESYLSQIKKIAQEREKKKKQAYEKMNPIERILKTGGYAGGSAIITVITTPEFILEEGIGRIHSKLEGGAFEPKDYFKGDWSREELLSDWVEKDLGGPPGLLTFGMETVTATLMEGLQTGEWEVDIPEEDWELIQKYPIEAIFATVSEAAVFAATSKVVHLTKVSAVKSASWVNREFLGGRTFPKVSPVQIYRKVTVGIQERLHLKTRLPEKQVWDTTVLKGTERFAKTKGGVKKMAKIFESTQTLPESKGKIVAIHASPYKWGKYTYTKLGSSETPGLSISARGAGSPYFLQVEGSTKYASKLTLFPKFKAPTAPLIKLDKLYRLPKSIRYTIDTKPGVFKAPSAKYITEQPKGPYAWFAPKAELGGPEIEAIIGPKTWMKRSNYTYFTTYKGSIIPLPEYNIISSGQPSSFSRVLSAVETTKFKVSTYGTKISHSSYYSLPSSPIINISSISSLARSSSLRSSISSSSVSSSISFGSYRSSLSSASSSSISSSMRSIPSSLSSSSSSSSSYSPSYSVPSSSYSFSSSYSAPSSSKYPIIYYEPRKKKTPPSRFKKFRIKELTRWRVHDIKLPKVNI